MSDIRSFVRRNSRLTDSHRKHIHNNDGILVETLPENRLKKASFVGLEIGFGMGDSLLDVAEKHPDQLWIGIEVYEIGIASVIRQAKEKKLDNILLLCGDAVTLLEADFLANTFDHIRVFFPDPWPKKRHHKRRIMRQEMLTMLAPLMKSNAKLHFATDNLNYAEETLEVLKKLPLFKISDETLFRPETKFARKAIAAGSTITDIVIVKQDS